MDRPALAVDIHRIDRGHHDQAAGDWVARFVLGERQGRGDRRAVIVRGASVSQIPGDPVEDVLPPHPDLGEGRRPGPTVGGDRQAIGVPGEFEEQGIGPARLAVGRPLPGHRDRCAGETRAAQGDQLVRALRDEVGAGVIGESIVIRAVIVTGSIVVVPGVGRSFTGDEDKEREEKTHRGSSYQPQNGRRPRNVAASGPTVLGRSRPSPGSRRGRCIRSRSCHRSLAGGRRRTRRR